MSPLSSCWALLPQHVSLYLQDVCPCDGGAGGGDRSLAHRHERAQVSHPARGSLLQSPGRHRLGSLLHTPSPTSLAGEVWFLFLEVLSLFRSQPTRKRGGRGQAKGEGFNETRSSPLCRNLPLPAALWLYQYPVALPLSPFSHRMAEPFQTHCPTLRDVGLSFYCNFFPTKGPHSPKRMLLRLHFAFCTQSVPSAIELGSPTLIYL